jgi:hypothetical protein
VVLLLTVPVFAAWAIMPGAQIPETVLVPSDDVVANRLQIVDSPEAAARPEARPEAGTSTVEKVLRNWTYTGRPSPSPGH